MLPDWLVIAGSISPFVGGGAVYALRNEKRLTELETTEESVKEEIAYVRKRVDQLYDLALQKSPKEKGPD